ncbi:hypothetical protein AQ487_06920 [Enterococcus faecalis]|nr:hypothetical protein AQ487_06920 [Enterococcus faecalis]
MSLGQKSLWIFVPGLKIDKQREQKQHYALLRSQQLLRAKALRVEGPGTKIQSDFCPRFLSLFYFKPKLP